MLPRCRLLLLHLRCALCSARSDSEQGAGNAPCADVCDRRRQRGRGARRRPASRRDGLRAAENARPRVASVDAASKERPLRPRPGTEAAEPLFGWLIRLGFGGLVAGVGRVVGEPRCPPVAPSTAPVAICAARGRPWRRGKIDAAAETPAVLEESRVRLAPRLVRLRVHKAGDEIAGRENELVRKLLTSQAVNRPRAGFSSQLELRAAGQARAETGACAGSAGVARPARTCAAAPRRLVAARARSGSFRGSAAGPTAVRRGGVEVE